MFAYFDLWWLLEENHEPRLIACGLWQYVDSVKVGRYFNLQFAPNVLRLLSTFLRLLSRLGHELTVLECTFGNRQQTLCYFYHMKNGKT